MMFAIGGLFLVCALIFCLFMVMVSAARLLFFILIKLPAAILVIGTIAYVVQHSK